MTPPELPAALVPERLLHRTPLGEAWAVRTAEGAPATAVVVAPELLLLVQDRARLLEGLRAAATPADLLAAAPALLPLLDVQVAADGRPVLVLAREERAPASERLQRGRAFASADVAGAVRAVGHALGALHASGARHGAVCPGLVHVGGDQPPRLVGAGVVEAFVAAGVARGDLLRLLGAQAFAAPELAAAGAAPDVRSDVFALGATLYACLTGKPPFGGRTTAFTMAAVLADEGLSGEVQGLPAGADDATLAAHAAATERLTDALLRAVERAPDDRWHAMADMVRALDPRVPTPPELPVPAAARAAARRGCLTSVVLLATVAAVAAATIAAR